MNALIYCRVSSDRQVKEGNGNGSQEQRCRSRAKEKGWPIVKVFPDEGVSGKLFERPAMRSLLEYIDDHPTDKFVVIFDDLSRFARDVQVHIQLKLEFEKRGVKRECLNFGFDDSEESEYAELILAAGNQYQRKSNRRQVIQKQRARMENGYWSLCLPPGLVNQKHPVHRKIAISNEPLASIFKQAIESFRDRTLRTPDEVRLFIENEYRKRNIKRKISLNGANRILRQILYAGYIEYPHWEIKRMKAIHDGFISIDTYNEVQSILTGRAKPKSRIDTSPDFPLRNLVLCSTCQKPMTASWNTSRNGQQYPNYFCKTKGCIQQWKVIHKDDIEPKFEKLLIEKAPDDATLGLTLDVFTDVWTQMQSDAVSIQTARTNELRDLTEAITNLTKRVANTTDSCLINAYEGEIKNLVTKKTTLETKTDQQRYTKEQFGTASNKVLTTLKNPVTMWKSDDADERYTIFSMYFEEKPIYDRVTGFGTNSLSSPIKLFDAMKASKNYSVEMPSNELGSE